MPRLPRERPVDVAKCHACHPCQAKCRGVTGDQRRPSAPPAKCHKCHAELPRETPVCRQVPRLPRNVPRCHGRPTATKRANVQTQPSAMSAMPATQNGGRCEQVPRLPHKVPRRHGRLTGLKRATRSHPFS